MKQPDQRNSTMRRGSVSGLHRRLVLAAGLCAVSMASLGAPTTLAATRTAPVAHLAGSLSLNESGRLHLTSHHGFTLNEQGSASGAITGTIYIHLHVVSTNRVTAEVSLYPSGGSITGLASASYRPSGAVASFSGTMNIARGTGRYAHAGGSGLSFTGTIRRTDDAVTVHVSGRMSD
jgi:hypothetical protein